MYQCYNRSCTNVITEVVTDFLHISRPKIVRNVQHIIYMYSLFVKLAENLLFGGETCGQKASISTVRLNCYRSNVQYDTYDYIIFMSFFRPKFFLRNYSSVSKCTIYKAYLYVQSICQRHFQKYPFWTCGQKASISTVGLNCYRSNVHIISLVDVQHSRVFLFGDQF